MKVHPYLFFGGRTEEAIEFYRQTLGAELTMLMRHKENPEPAPPGMVPPGWEDKVMHAEFRVGDNVIFGSDGCGEQQTMQGFSLALSLADVAKAERAFAALGDGGQVMMPLTKTFFSPAFGMVTDRFGVHWMVMAEQPAAAGK